jgi:uncharacterized membrane protein YraQ (UPF0718 family)
MENKHGKKVFKIIGMVFAGIAFAVLFAFVFGLVVQYLWNYLMPDLFGLKAITYWQAFALVILAKIFFGALGAHHGSHHYNGHSKWKKCGGPGSEYHDLDIHYEKARYYKDFWIEEGKKAFEEYVKKVKAVGKKQEE